jgi:hypothetical protein
MGFSGYLWDDMRQRICGKALFYKQFETLWEVLEQVVINGLF